MKSVSKNNDSEIDKIIRLMQTDKSFDAPPHAIQWSKNIFRARAAERKKPILERVRAILQINLSPNRGAFGERSASVAQAHQMLFRAGDASVDLRIKKTGKTFEVRGQILGTDFVNAAVRLGLYETKINEIGEFKFANVPDGKYDLSFQNRKTEIVIEDIEIR